MILRPFSTTPSGRSGARPLAAVLTALLAAGCASGRSAAPAASEHAGHTMPMPAPSAVPASADLPPDAAGAIARLDASPRHGEWAVVHTPDGDSVRAWVVYPQRSTKAPVVVVVHEIFGLSSWVRAVADQLAAAGFIAVAPDLLTGVPLGGNPDSVSVQTAVAAVSKLDAAQTQRRIAAAAAYGMALPSAEPRYGVIGFCWGGSAVFSHAVFDGERAAADPSAPALGAAVVYYGAAPKPDVLRHERAPILGLFGADDARVTATLPPADSTLRTLGRSYAFAIYPGAGHGFLRQQGAMQNLAASQQAWPRTVGWLRQNLER